MKNGIILLDKYDMYSADMNQNNRKFLETSGLKAVQIDTLEANNILQNEASKTSRSGSIFVASTIQNNRFYSLLNSIEGFREEYTELLFRYAPLLNMKTIKLHRELIDVKKEYHSSNHKANTSNNFHNAQGEMKSQNKNANNSTYTNYEYREFEKGQKIDEKEVIKKIQDDGINYKRHKVLNELVHRHCKDYRSEIILKEELRQSSDIWGKLDFNVPLPYNIKADYENKKTSEIEKIQSMAFSLEITFY